jgi:hypothetical protein
MNGRLRLTGSVVERALAGRLTPVRPASVDRIAAAARNHVFHEIRERRAIRAVRAVLE